MRQNRNLSLSHQLIAGRCMLHSFLKRSGKKFGDCCHRHCWSAADCNCRTLSGGFGRSRKSQTGCWSSALTHSGAKFESLESLEDEQNLKSLKTIKKILETISCRKWQKMEMPEWAHLEMEQIDFQDFAHRVLERNKERPILKFQVLARAEKHSNNIKIKGFWTFKEFYFCKHVL